MTSPALPNVDALLPCPFCGGAPVFDGHPGGVMGQIRCSNHDCFGPKTTALHRADSIQQWNTRASPEPKSDSGLGMTATIEQWPGPDPTEGAALARENHWRKLEGRDAGPAPPSREAAEGAGKRTAPDSCPHCFNEHDCDCVDVCNAVAVPPKPAPDAMREALERIIAIDQREKKTTIEIDPAGNTYDIAMVDGPLAKIARAALSAPVPPADGAKIINHVRLLGPGGDCADHKPTSI